jgi:hypothetical protein
LLTDQFIRINRAFVFDSTEPVGNIYISSSNVGSGGIPTDLDDIKAKIIAGNNQTLMTIYTVPAGHTAFFLDAFAGVLGSGAKNANVQFRIRNQGGVFRVQTEVGLAAGGAFFSKSLPAALVLIEKTDCLWRMTELSGAGVSVSATYEMLLLPDNIDRGQS